MRRLAKRAVVITFAVAGFGIAAVGLATGGSGAAAEGSGQPRAVVEVSFDEWRIEAGEAPVRAGRVTFQERNAGAVAHDLMVVRTDRPPDALPRGLQGVAPELAGDIVFGKTHSGHRHDASASAAAGHAHAGKHLDAGGRRRRTVRLDPGRYVVLCPIPGHYERGQAAVITVR